MDFIKRRINKFIMLGYMGLIEACSGEDYKSRTHDIREKATISHPKKSIILEWNERFGGSKKNLREIINRCETLGLKNLQP